MEQLFLTPKLIGVTGLLNKNTWKIEKFIRKDELTNISKSPIVYPDLNCINLNGRSIRSLSDILNMTNGLMDPLNESCPKINGHMKKNNERIIIIINNLITRHAF